MSDESGSVPIIGTRPRPRLPLWVNLWSLGSLALGVWWIGPRELAVWLIWPAYLIFRSVRPPTVVTADGISRPWRWHWWVDWATVTSVLEPVTGGPHVAGFAPPTVRVELVLRSGRHLRLDDMDAHWSGEVAARGGKPLEPLAVPPPIAPPPREPTEAERAADVLRRAQALTRGWADLDERSGRRTEPPPAR